MYNIGRNVRSTIFVETAKNSNDSVRQNIEQNIKCDQCDIRTKRVSLTTVSFYFQHCELRVIME